MNILTCFQIKTGFAERSEQSTFHKPMFMKKSFKSQMYEYCLKTNGKCINANI